MSNLRIDRTPPNPVCFSVGRREVRKASVTANQTTIDK